MAGEHQLNMTHLAINRSRSTNAVAKKHQQISKEMFKDLPVDVEAKQLQLPGITQMVFSSQ